jgi:hypothetical protein
MVLFLFFFNKKGDLSMLLEKQKNSFSLANSCCMVSLIQEILLFFFLLESERSENKDRRPEKEG